MRKTIKLARFAKTNHFEGRKQTTKALINCLASFISQVNTVA